MSIVEVPLCLQCGVPHIPEDIANRVRSGERITVHIIPHSQGIATNVLRWGTGGINVDKCRIGTSDNLNGGAYAQNGTHRDDGWGMQRGGAGEFVQPQGRWPANLLLDSEAAAMLDEQSGERKSGGRIGTTYNGQGAFSTSPRPSQAGKPCNDFEPSTGGASRFFLRVDVDDEPLRMFYCGKASRKDRNQGVEELITWDSVDLNQETEQLYQLAKGISDDTMRLLEGCERSTMLFGSNTTGQCQKDTSRIILTLTRLITELRTYKCSPSLSTRGYILVAIRTMTADGLNLAESVESLSRLTQSFMNAEIVSLLGVVNAALTMLLQISAKGRLGNTHSTVKPTMLCRWLAKLICRPGGTILDPFAGSGSTGKAAMLEGFNFVGIDTDSEYLAIAEKRIEHARLSMVLPLLEVAR